MSRFNLGSGFPLEPEMQQADVEAVLENLDFGQEHPLKNAGAFGKAWLQHTTASAARAALIDSESLSQNGALSLLVETSYITPGVGQTLSMTLGDGSGPGSRKVRTQ